MTTATANQKPKGAQAPSAFDEEEFSREISKPNGWSEIKDPVAYIRRMRGDPDYTGFNKMRDALRALVEYWDWCGYDALREAKLKEDARAALAEAEAD